MKASLFIIVSIFCAYSLVTAQPLAGTDDLGRVLVQNNSVGSPKADKYIAMFYFLWQGDKSSVTSPYHWDLHELFTKNPKVFADADDPGWGGKKGTYYFWGQPVYGYYRGDDYWVHLRNMQLLADAGVDLLVIDATNNLIYPAQSAALMKAMETVRAQGKNPPKIVYYTNTQSGETMQAVYDNYYKSDAPHRYPDCWFYLDAKPLIIGVTKEAAGKDYTDFFTFRESQWPTVPQVENGWPWISFKRKPEVHFNSKGEREIINVSVAQHPNPTAGMGGSAFYGNMDNWGRSYHNNSHGNPEKDIVYGYNFQEQWDYALQENTRFIFVTGWNEWVAGRWNSMDDNPKHSWFCDQASPEYSRDIEPSLTAGLKDHYYMQLVNNIRRYKGIEGVKPDEEIRIIKKMSDWENVPDKYFDYTGDTQKRDHPGAQSQPVTVYKNTTGRNDFSVLKVATGKNDLFFYAETVTSVTALSGDNWMRLYIDIDKNFRAGWKGYDFRVLKGSVIEKFDGNKWVAVKNQKATYRIEGRKLMVTIPRAALNILHTSPSFEFKWSDNMQNDDPMDWYVNGDAAPGGRFNYQYLFRQN